jgi:ABC-type branched-subunit amino acid transport system ATPase component
MELFDSLTVTDNVALGLESRLAGRNPWRLVFSSPSARSTVREATEAALAECGLVDLAGRRTSALSTGQRRLVELARAIAGGFTVLLLDEPSSGLDHDETERFGEILRDLVDRRGVSILLIEHDMALVMSVCDYLYVLDFGTLIFEGTPAAVQASPVVRAAYLGDEDGFEQAGLAGTETGSN